MSSLTVRHLLRGADQRAVNTIWSCWTDRTQGDAGRGEMVRDLASAMGDGARVEGRLQGLSKKLADLLDRFMSEPGTPRTVSDLLAVHAGHVPSRGEIDAAVAALCRDGFVVAWPRNGAEQAWVVPGELADCIDERRRRQENEIENTITLRGFLNTRYFDRRQRMGDPDERSADHARKVYKIYLMESSILSRIAKLPDPVRKVWNCALSRFGGLMPTDEIAAALGEDGSVDLDLLRKCLEDGMLGTVAPLRLTRFGIQPSQSVVIVFYEIALICLRLHGDKFPVAVEQVITAGVDMVSNVGRFLRELDQSRVQFTVEGKLYKASEKRIMKRLLGVPGGYFDAKAQIRFIYKFCLSRRLLDRSGERALRPTDSGRQFDQLSLLEKLRTLLAYSVEERGMPGEDFHQVRLRRILLRLLKRVEPDEWHELLFAPFLARNSYLSNLDALRVEESFATRFKVGGYLPTENLQQICWNLVLFVKRRLYPLGLVDLGLRGGRPVAVRLSRLGAELLGATSAGNVGGDRSEVVVNPDFELILFPGEDEHEVVHTFDRFAERVKTDHIYHFRLSRETVHGALKDGMSVAQVIAELTDRSRTALPQNVIYSLEDWAQAAGLLVLDGSVLRCKRSDLVDRFVAVPKIQELVAVRDGPNSVVLKEPVPFEILQHTAREYGFFVEERRS